MTRLLRAFRPGPLGAGAGAVLALLLVSGPLSTAPASAAQRTDALTLAASAPAVSYAKEVVLTATLAAAQPDGQVVFFAKAAGGPDKQVGGALSGAETRVKLNVAVTRTATYYAVLFVGGAATAQSAPVDVLVAPVLTLKTERLVGAAYHFIVKVKPVADGIPIVLQRLVDHKWKKIDKNVTDDGLVGFISGIPADVASKWRVFVRGSRKYGEATSRVVRVVDPTRVTAR